MDIQQWLANTADRQPPDQHEGPGAPDFIQPQREPEELARKYRRKRKRASSDSSIIEIDPAPSHRRRTKTGNRAYSADGLRSAGDAGARSAQGSDDAEPEVRPVPAKTYEKRARHKTKPDRYDPKPRKHTAEREARDARKEKPRRRKSHRSGDGERTTGLVQSFQLKHGSKNSRLTIRPEMTAGIFKHGRASEQVAAKGAGLPDLVFNEMRFLQKPHDHQDDQRKHESERRTKDTHRRTVPEEEVSAYFAAKRSAEQSAADVGSERHPRRAGDRQRAAERQAITEPPVELPEKPFLGFGSKNIHSDPKKTGPTSGSYYSWSESVAEHLLPARHTETEARAEDQERRTKPPILDQQEQVPRSPKTAQRSPVSDEAPDMEKIEAQGTWIHSRRIRGSQVVEVFQPPAEPRVSGGEHPRAPSRATEQSLPTHLPSEPPVYRPGQHRSDTRRSHTYHTSDILYIHERDSRSPADVSRRHSRRASDRPHHEKENVDPRSSTPTSKLLQRAKDAVSAPERHRRPPALSRPNAEQHSDSHVQMQAEANGPPAGCQGNGFGADRTHSDNDHADLGLRERRLQSANGVRPNPTPRKNPATSFGAHGRYVYPFGVEDDMLDNFPDADPITVPGLVYASARQVEDLVHAQPHDHAPGLYEAQAEQMFSEEVDSRVPSEALIGAARTSSPHDRSDANALRSEQYLASVQPADIGAEGDFAGFWKPNRLY